MKPPIQSTGYYMNLVQCICLFHFFFLTDDVVEFQNKKDIQNRFLRMHAGLASVGFLDLSDQQTICTCFAKMSALNLSNLTWKTEGWHKVHFE
jgi:hypothetical protein